MVDAGTDESLLFVSLLLCVYVSSSVITEEDAVVDEQGVTIPEEEETFDSSGCG